MPIMITIAFLAAVIAFTCPALAAGSDNRDDKYGLELAQYCMPLDDGSGAQRFPYC
jgi:hypothetical protein